MAIAAPHAKVPSSSVKSVFFVMVILLKKLKILETVDEGRSVCLQNS
jgi:hypothetical protein